MSKWEYKKVITPTVLSEEQMNFYGQDGWENYAIVGNAYWFKKQGEIKVVELKKESNGSKNRK